MVIIERLDDAEKRGRYLATIGITKPYYGEVIMWAIQIKLYTKFDIPTFLYNIRYDGPLFDVSDKIHHAAESVELFAKVCRLLCPGTLTEGCTTDILYDSDRRAIEISFNDLDDAAKKVFGTRCTYMFGIFKPYPLTAAVNDLTACFHALVNFMVIEEKRRKRTIYHPKLVEK